MQSFKASDSARQTALELCMLAEDYHKIRESWFVIKNYFSHFKPENSSTKPEAVMLWDR